MAAAIMDGILAETGASAGSGCCKRLARLAGEPAWQPALLVLAPLLFLPEGAPLTPALLHASGAAILLCLLDALVATTVLRAPGRPSRRLALTVLGAIAAAATLVVLLGRGLPVLAFVFLPLLVVGRFWSERSWPLAALVAAFAAACRVEAGGLAAGLMNQGWLLMAVAAAGAFHAVATARLRLAARHMPMRVISPSRTAQARDLLLLLLLSSCVGASFALLGSEARLAAMGAPLALLPAPFALLGALRAMQIVMTARDPRRLGLRDPTLAIAAVGWAGVLLLSPMPAALP